MATMNMISEDGRADSAAKISDQVVASCLSRFHAPECENVPPHVYVLLGDDQVWRPVGQSLEQVVSREATQSALAPWDTRKASTPAPAMRQQPGAREGTRIPSHGRAGAHGQNEHITQEEE